MFTYVCMIIYRGWLIEAGHLELPWWLAKVHSLSQNAYWDLVCSAAWRSKCIQKWTRQEHARRMEIMLAVARAHEDTLRCEVYPDGENSLYILRRWSAQSNISRCNTLQHTVYTTSVVCTIKSITLQHTATHCNILQHTAHTASVVCTVECREWTPCSTRQHTATHDNTL